MIRLTFLLSIWCSAQSVLAQFQVTYRYSFQDGLAGNSVYDLLQDDEGFMWFATNHGVSRFDGHQFINFHKSDGLPDEEVIKLGRDVSGRIWFLGFNGKSSYFQSGQFYDESRSPLAAAVQLQSPFCSFLQSKNGVCYLVSNTDGFIRLAGDQVMRFSMDSVRRYTGIAAINGFRSVKLDTADNLWIIGADSAWIFEKGKLSLSSCRKTVASKNLLGSKFLKNGSVATLLDEKIILRHGNTSDSLIIPGLDPWHDYSVTEEDAKGNLWLLTKSGAYFFRGQRLDKSHTVKVLSGEFTGHIFSDSEGNTWCTLLKQGVCMFPSTVIQFLKTESGLAGNEVMALALHPEGIIAGFSNGSLQMIKTENGSLSITPPVKAGSYFVDIFHSARNAWSILTASGLATCDDQLRLSHQINIPWVKSGCVAEDGSVYIGGIYRFGVLRENELKFLHVFPFENRIYSIAPDDTGGVWLGTEKGLYCYHDSVMTYYGETYPLANGRIDDLKFDKQHRLWIASSHAGLLLLDGKKMLKMGVGDETFSAHRIIVADNGTIYAATSIGILSVRNSASNAFSIERIDQADGLVTENINALLLRDNTLWIGTDGGLQVLPLDQLLREPADIPVRLLSFSVNGQAASLTDEMNLQHLQNNIRLAYTGISLRPSQPVRYRYKLHEQDTAWTYTTNSSLDLPDLPFGMYRILVEAGTTESNWSSLPLAISFSIPPPFWYTWWFILLVALAVALILFLAIRWWYRWQTGREAMKRKSVESELAALRSQMNPHFVFNSLNAIQDFIMSHKTEEANEYLAKFAKLMRAILNHSRMAFVSIEEECDLLNTYLELEALRFNQAFDWTITQGKGIVPADDEIPGMLLQPVVENSVRHGFRSLERKGHLSICFEKEDGYIRCEVQDNGHGRIQGTQRDGQSHALILIHERLNLLNQSAGRPSVMEVCDVVEKGEIRGVRTVFKFAVSANGKKHPAGRN